jgi:hypothetical protein
MNETTTVAIVAVAAVGLFLLYESSQARQQSQDATTAVLLGKVLQPAVQPNPLSSLTSLLGPVISAL